MEADIVCGKDKVGLRLDGCEYIFPLDLWYAMNKFVVDYQAGKAVRFGEPIRSLPSLDWDETLPNEL